jgi:hypothetical protein
LYQSFDVLRFRHCIAVEEEKEIAEKESCFVENPIFFKRSPELHTFEFVWPQNVNRCATGWRESLEENIIPEKMIGPYLAARIKKRNYVAVMRVDAAQIGSLAQIASQA